MTLPVVLKNAAAKFDGLSVRERALVSLGVLGLVLFVSNSILMKPLDLQRAAVAQELDSLKQGSDAMSEVNAAQANGGPFGQALMEQRQLQLKLARVNGELNASSAGLVDPRRMSSLMRDLLAQQHGLKLISLKNLPVTSLVQQPTVNGAPPAPPTGPYVHPAELIVEGSYLDVLAYLRAVEALPWRFYWKKLDLQVGEYPNSTVRIELCTLSMDKEWLGV